jgi:Asp-tRNA(Asn)/Glu-tRNA(Gln) amidotransferase C subunit
MAMLSAEEVKKIAHLARLGIEEKNVDASKKGIAVKIKRIISVVKNPKMPCPL